MQPVQTDFWTTSAQTMPVLALAIVVEARAIAAKWLPGEARAYRALMGIFWATPLVIYALALPPCFYALSGSAVWTGWSTAIPLGVQLGASSLILNPAIEILMRANAHNVARLITLKQASAFRKQRRRRNRMKRAMRKNVALLDRMEIDARSTRHELDRGKLKERPYKNEYLPLLAEALRRIYLSRAEFAELINDIETAEADAATISAELRGTQLDAIEARILGVVASSERVSVEPPN